jgi:cation:H+ antiporter
MTPERPAHPARQRVTIFLVGVLAIPGLVLRLSGGHPQPWVAAVLLGFAIVSGAFMLAWAAEVAQLDISQALALAALALIAVLPEYAVTFVFAARAGHEPGRYSQFVLANMTGANRLLIGLGWSMVVLVATWRWRRRGVRHEAVDLERPHSIEVSFLAVATLYSLTLPLKRTITIIDAVILVAIFAGYVARVSRAPAGEPHLVGPAQYLGTLTVVARRTAVVGMFLFAAAVIVVAADPFADALLETGRQFHLDEFLLVQWLAPLASEAPEMLVAGLFAWRLNTNAGLGALVSSKVNQWTLLVGTVPVVFAVASAGSHGLPINHLVREELFLTAAQSAYAVATLANRRLSLTEAWWLLGLFMAQFVLGGVLPVELRSWNRIGFGSLYMVLATGVILADRRAVPKLLRDGFRTPVGRLNDEVSA